MALRLQDVKYVDARSQRLLCGYLRNIYNDATNNNEHIIPDLVLNICLLFYFQREYFSVIVNGWKGRENFKLSNNDMTASLVDGCYGNLYGNIKIDSLSEAVYKWTIKVENDKKKEMAPELGLTTQETTDEIYGGYNAPKNAFIRRVRIWKHGDVVDIKLDLQKRNIEYFINDKIIDVRFDDIPVGVGIKYRLMVYMSMDGQSASIKNFERI